ncbi:MAG: flavodoxin FldA, partial [Okeania sp. SIO2H7]|nr:flavodoxin FldA [Okeania sp. SIO2H7]
MSQIGLFVGSTTGKTETAAETVQKEFGGEDIVTILNVADIEASELENYDKIIIGCPTWDIGALQSDWEGLFDDLDSIDFSGKKVAYFGTG